VNLTDVLHQMTQQTMRAYGMTDLAVGTVVSTDPLAVKLREDMADIPEEGLWLTAGVMEKKIPVLLHEHITSGLKHSHTVSTPEGSYTTSDGLAPDRYASDQRLDKIVCYEDGTPLPVENGFIILNRGLRAGDQVLLLKVLRSQQFVILSRIFERGAQRAASI